MTTPAPKKDHPAAELTDQELEAFAQRLDDGYQIPRAGTWRKSLSGTAGTPVTVFQVPQTGRVLLSDDAYHSHLKPALEIWLKRRLELKSEPRPTNEQAVTWVLQKLCGNWTEPLTVLERQRFLEAIVPVMEETIRQVAAEVPEDEASSTMKSKVCQSSVDGSAPDTNRASFHTAIHHPKWVIERLELLAKFTKSSPELGQIFRYHEFTDISEQELASCFGQSVEFVDSVLLKVGMYLESVHAAAK